ncbi:hypothetical protein [Chitinophaga nivalis]|uniref:Carboxypeptidase regulatory-like domain-containing protein n=1 Tax=Chitinophaga nivalis TaxID=2991709 RepID=A0ABT3IVG9_9BACT|nr:hypothetical protein [Chitinophaga nivalis]MCW3462352.1 hypothetical protein [Chitinophaga nivalis]MCW3487957.1 hypothetical protein [Chitinophaga nivalis]
MFKNVLWWLALPLVLLSACDKSMVTVKYPNEIVPPVNNNNPIPTQQVKTGIQGIILDENNRPVQGASVKAGQKTISTNAKGYFLLDDITVVKAAAVVTVTKSGYFDGIRTFSIPADNKLQYVQIQLLPKKVAGVFDGATGGNITASNAQFIFRPNHVLNADNTPYTGKVSLYYAPINPERADFADIMPGDLRGINNGNALVGLKSYGMMALEVRGAAGEKLHLDSSMSVTFKVTIPATLLSSAPATIPLWHFDEKIGVWREEGSANKVGDSYLGSLKHFSTWTHSLWFWPAYFTATLQNETGSPLAFFQIKMTRQDGTSSFDYTNENGEVQGVVPANESLTMTVVKRHGTCEMEMLSRKVGPWTAFNSLGIIKVTPAAGNTLRISGTVTNCDNNPVTNGIVNVTVESKLYRALLKNGTYNITALHCEATATDVSINAIDLATNKTIARELTAVSVDQVADLQVCDVIEQSTASLIVDGTSYTYTTPADIVDLSSDTSDVYRVKITKNPFGNIKESCVLILAGLEKGTHVRNMHLNLPNVFLGGDYSYTVTQEAPRKGDFLIFTINGKLRNAQDYTDTRLRTISGTVKVKRLW